MRFGFGHNENGRKTIEGIAPASISNIANIASKYKPTQQQIVLSKGDESEMKNKTINDERNGNVSMVEEKTDRLFTYWKKRYSLF